MSTGHANSPKDMLTRLETMVLTGIDMPLTAIRTQIASAIDIIVHLGRIRDRSRRVMEIDEVKEYKDGEIIIRPLYIFRECGEKDGMVQGSLERTENKLINTEKLKRKGIKI